MAKKAQYFKENMRKETIEDGKSVSGSNKVKEGIIMPDGTACTSMKNVVDWLNTNVFSSEHGGGFTIDANNPSMDISGDVTMEKNSCECQC